MEEGEQERYKAKFSVACVHCSRAAGWLLCLQFGLIVNRSQTFCVHSGKFLSEGSLETLSHCLQSGSRTDRGGGVWRDF